MTNAGRIDIMKAALQRGYALFQQHNIQQGVKLFEQAFARLNMAVVEPIVEEDEAVSGGGATKNKRFWRPKKTSRLPRVKKVYGGGDDGIRGLGEKGGDRDDVVEEDPIH